MCTAGAVFSIHRPCCTGATSAAGIPSTKHFNATISGFQIVSMQASRWLVTVARFMYSSIVFSFRWFGKRHCRECRPVRYRRIIVLFGVQAKSNSLPDFSDFSSGNFTISPEKNNLLFIFRHPILDADPLRDGYGGDSSGILVGFQPFPHLTLTASTVRTMLASTLFPALCNVTEVSFKCQSFSHHNSHSPR